MCCAIKPTASWLLEEVISLFEQLTLINTGKHRSCLCAERDAEARATFLATGLFFSCEEKLVILCSLSRFGTFLGLAHAAMTAEGDNSVLMQKVFCILNHWT